MKQSNERRPWRASPDARCEPALGRSHRMVHRSCGACVDRGDADRRDDRSAERWAPRKPSGEVVERITLAINSDGVGIDGSSVGRICDRRAGSSAELDDSILARTERPTQILDGAQTLVLTRRPLVHVGVTPRGFDVGMKAAGRASFERVVRGGPKTDRTNTEFTLAIDGTVRAHLLFGPGEQSPFVRVSSTTRPAPASSRSAAVRPSAARSNPVPRNA